LPALTAIDAGGPTTPVAVNVTGLPVKVPLVAVSEFGPGVLPSVQLPTVAIPLPFVVALAPVTLPPPDATANVTLTPLTGLPPASFTITLGGVATAEPAFAVCPSPPFRAIDAGGAAVAVAVNVTGLPDRLPLEAVSEFAPTEGPSVQLPTVAMPLPFVVVVRPVALPPPDATANVTLTPPTGLPTASVTITLGGVATAVPTVAL
jgi:hypothetical protein